ncbi:Protein arginine N-methyltransferase 7, partial [Durusdinium trenchii]
SALFARYRPRYLQGLNRSAATRVAESVETLATAEIGWKSLAHVYCMSLAEIHLRNLDHRKERWDFMQRQFLQLKMPVERFSAVNGRELDVPELAMQLAMRKMEGMAACGE